MRKFKIIILSIAVTAMFVTLSAFTKATGISISERIESKSSEDNVQKPTANMLVTHGHCSTPFTGALEELKVDLVASKETGNPIENMEISFIIDPSSFNVCADQNLTERIKTPGIFVGKNNEMITFKSLHTRTIGLDWYQTTGMLSIKGVEHEVTFFVSGIRDPEKTMTSTLIIDGQLDLFDWGIDYDKIVSGKSDMRPTRWLHINLKYDFS